LILQIRFFSLLISSVARIFSSLFFSLGVRLTPLLRVDLPSVSEFCFSGGLSSELCARGFGYRAVSSTRSVSVPVGVGPKAPFFARSIQPKASPGPFTGAWFSRCPESPAADFQCVLPCPAGTRAGAWSQFDLVTV
jgi:hypothetical protein